MAQIKNEAAYRAAWTAPEADYVDYERKNETDEKRMALLVRNGKIQCL